MKKKRGAGKRTDWRKTNIDSCNSPVYEFFVWCSFRERVTGRAAPRGRAGSQVQTGEVGGEFPPRRLTVLTAAHWSVVASPLKRDTGRCTELRGGRSRRARARAKLEDKERRGRRGMTSIWSDRATHQVASNASCVRAGQLCPCAEQLLLHPDDRCTQTLDILPIHRQISLSAHTITVALQQSRAFQALAP